MLGGRRELSSREQRGLPRLAKVVSLAELSYRALRKHTSAPILVKLQYLQHFIPYIETVCWYAWKQRTTKKLHEKGGAADDLR